MKRELEIIGMNLNIELGTLLRLIGVNRYFNLNIVQVRAYYTIL